MYLRTFGGLSIEAEPREGLSLGPRRLALLALLAAAGPRGITREKLLGILWPETDEEQARHTLSQTLYSLRRDTGRECIAGSSLLRLHESITSDVSDFQEALKANQLAHAATLYTGPFLDGFYLPAAAQFEEWVEETRARLQFSALKTLESLARQADDAGAHRDATSWWRRLVEIDPFSAVYAVGQIRALMAGGDQASALRFAREYEARVRRELASEPDTRISQLIATLRTPAATALAPAPIPTPAQHQPTTPVNAVVPTRHLSRRAVWLPAAIIAVLVTAAIASGIGRSRAGNDAPFLAIGAIQSKDSAGMGPVLRDMLATNLARIGGVQVVANYRLLELLSRSAGPTPAATADAARRAGAKEIIEGELGIGASAFVLTLRRVALSGGVVRGGYTVRASDVYALIDSATAAIARDLQLEPPTETVGNVSTSSPIAYALYEQGLRALYQGDNPAANRLMMAALERDSTFAMAAFFAWNAAEVDEQTRMLPLVKRLATRAVDRERLWIQSSIAQREAPIAEFLGLARELTDRFPNDPDGQMVLAGGLASAGDALGAVAAFNRAIAIDSVAGAATGSYCRVCTALHALMHAYLGSDSVAAAERTARRLIAFRPAEASGWHATIEPLLRAGRRAEAEAAVARATKLSAVKTNYGPQLDRDLIRSGRSDELEVRLVSEFSSGPSRARSEASWLLAFALRNQGRLQEAESLAAHGRLPRSATRLDGPSDAISLAIIALERGQSRESARRFLEMVAADRASQAALGFKSRVTAWHMTLAGTALAAAGDTAAVRVLADSVERVGSNSNFGRDAKLHFFLRGLLLQRQSRHAEAVDAFRRSLFSLTEGYTRINLELARSLVALRRYPEAIAVLQPALRGGVDGSNSYVTHTELHEALALAFEAAGQRDSAALHFAAVERAWRHADPQFSARYAKARAVATN